MMALTPDTSCVCITFFSALRDNWNWQSSAQSPVSKQKNSQDISIYTGWWLWFFPCFFFQPDLEIVLTCSTIFNLTSLGTFALPTGVNSTTNCSKVIGCNPFLRIASLAASDMTWWHSDKLACKVWWMRSISPEDSSLWRMLDSICCCCGWCWPSCGHGLYYYCCYLKRLWTHN